MKVLLIVFILACSILSSKAQKQETISPVLDKSKKQLVVEAGCGQCRFGLPGKSCDLAVRIEGKAYFVDGTKIDSHGDAHADDGFCNATKKATVQGEVIGRRFKATYFNVLPLNETNNKAPILKND